MNPIHRMPELTSWVGKVTVVHARILPRNWLLDHATLVAIIAGRSQALQVLHHWRKIQAPRDDARYAVGEHLSGGQSIPARSLPAGMV